MLTGFRGIPGSHTLYNKGDQDYEEMGLYSLVVMLMRVSRLRNVSGMPAKFKEQAADQGWLGLASMRLCCSGSPLEDIMADLRANFEGECSEVGMYLGYVQSRSQRGLS